MNRTIGLGLLLAAASVQGQAPIEATLGWNGHIAADAYTEIAISGRSVPGESLRVRTTGGSTQVEALMPAGNNGLSSVTLPLPVTGAGDIRLQAGTGNNTSGVIAAGRLRPGPGLVAIVGVRIAEKLESVPGTVAVAPTDLPRLGATYAHVRALVVDGTVLPELDAAQLRALLEYVGTCGRAVFAGASPAVQRTLEQRAGCGGRLLAMLPDDAPVDTALSALLDRRAAALPGARTLRTLLGDQSADFELLVLFLAGFVVVYLLLNALPRTRFAGLGFCLLASLLSSMLWSAESRQRFVAWSEVSDGERIARYSALEQLSATARGRQHVQPRSLAESPRTIEGNDLVVHWSDVPTERALEWQASLLEEAHLLTAGSFNVEPNLRAEIRDGMAVVCNQGRSPSPPAYLRWDNHNYAVPALAPTDIWSPGDDPALTESRPELRLLARRTQGIAVALLQPLRVPANGGRQDAWLLRLEVPGTEDSPCRD